MHSAVDDHTRLAYSEIHGDEKAATAPGFLTRAGEFFNTAVMTILKARHVFIWPHCPWHHGSTPTTTPADTTPSTHTHPSAE